MAEELQGLLERIQEEGVKKADIQKEEILSGAKVEAEKIVNEAKAQAESIRKDAEQDASGSEARAKAAIQQAARDIILGLKADLQDRLRNVVKDGIAEAMTPDIMGKILLEMVKLYREKNPDTDPAIEVLISRDDYDKMEKLFMGSIVDDLKSKPDISIGHDFTGGLKVGFKENDVFFDFSDDAISDLICSMVGPKLSEIFNSATSVEK